MMHTSESIKELAVALAKAQAQLRPALKDSVNPHFRSNYADLSSVWDACRDALTSNGLSIVQIPTDSEPGRVGLITMLMHSSGEYISGVVSTRLTKDDAQGLGSALTYLRRYALAAYIGVVADEDDDGNAASSQPQRARAAASAPVKSNGKATDHLSNTRDDLKAKVKALYADGRIHKQSAINYANEIDAAANEQTLESIKRSLSGFAKPEAVTEQAA